MLFENKWLVQEMSDGCITTSRRFKCVPQILGSLSIHVFKLLFFLITHSCQLFAYGTLSGSKLNVQTFSSLNFQTSLFAYNYFLKLQLLLHA